MIMGRNASKTPQAAAGAGQIPSVSVVIPGQTQVARSITASGPLAAKRDQPIGIAGSGGRIVRVLVDAGSWVRAGQVLAVVDRTVQAQQASQLAAQVEAARANAALAQNELRTGHRASGARIRLQSRDRSQEGHARRR